MYLIARQIHELLKPNETTYKPAHVKIVLTGIVYAYSEDSGEPAHLRRLMRAFAGVSHKRGKLWPKGQKSDPWGWLLMHV